MMVEKLEITEQVNIILGDPSSPEMNDMASKLVSAIATVYGIEIAKRYWMDDRLVHRTLSEIICGNAVMILPNAKVYTNKDFHDAIKVKAIRRNIHDCGNNTIIMAIKEIDDFIDFYQFSATEAVNLAGVYMPPKY